LLRNSILTDGEIPLEELAAFATREGRRPRPIYTAHKWFARRLGSVFRALLVGAVTSKDGNFWEAYYGDADLRGFQVLDPFVGGGTSVVEAQRLGASAHGIDVDPIACSVTNLELTAADIPDLSEVLVGLQEQVGTMIRPLHTFSHKGRQLQILHHFWVQVVTCGECGCTFEAHPNFRLAKEVNTQWVFCSHCGAVEQRRSVHKTFTCGACGQRTAIDEGVLDYGRATCPQCSYREPLIQLGRRTGKPPEWRLFAVEALQGAENKRPIPMKQREFFAASPVIVDLYNQASKKYRARRESHPHTFPDVLISDHDRADDRLIAYGYRRWTDLFNDRQLLHLSYLAEAIQKLEEPVRTPIAMAYSDHLTTNCMLTSYAAGWRRLTPLFSLRSFRHVPRPVELNPWMDRTGRGSFPNTVRKFMRAANFARTPKEPLANGAFVDVPPLSPEKRGEAVCGSARDLRGFADHSIDIVLSDPPYFDNIAYSELAEFFHPWLKMIGGIPSEKTLEQIKLESLVGRRTDPATLESYEKGLCEALGEVSRVLKETGILVFSFRHALPEVWHALARAISPHALEPVRVIPAPGESGMGLHAHSGTGRWDAILILRKGKAIPTFSNDLVVHETDLEGIVKQVDQWTARLKKSSLAFTQVDRTTIWRATLVMASLKKVAAIQPKPSADLPLLQALHQKP